LWMLKRLLKAAGFHRFVVDVETAGESCRGARKIDIRLRVDSDQ